ncbi:MAG: hypothetical protein GEU94_05145 [Micromonosporaceae bacterium]|nr:hypothetical protein [Micromonosporaceae bacterium]
MNRDEILLCTGLPPERAAEMLAQTLQATLAVYESVPVVYRRVVGEWHDRATVGGKVCKNYLRDETAAPHEQSIYDSGYDTIYEVWLSSAVPGDVGESLQAEEARRIFTEITERMPFPTVHTDGSALILSAWDPKLGRTDFPPGTGYDEEDRQHWEPYAHPGAPK